MSLQKALTLSTTITFGLTFLLTTGTAGPLAATFYGLFVAGIVGFGVFAAHSNPRPWYSSPWPRSSYFSGYYNDYSPRIFSYFYAPRARRSAMPLYDTAPAPTYYPSSSNRAAVPPTAHHTGSTFVPAARAVPIPRSAGSGAHHVSSEFVPVGSTPGRSYTPMASAASAAHPVSSSFRPIDVAPSHTPSGATHVSRTFVPK